MDGIIVSCAGDPGVKELKERLNIPVTGAGEPTAAYSLNFGERVGVLGIEKAPPASYERILGPRLVAYRKPQKVVSTNDLQTDEGRKSLISATLELKEKQVDVIALTCTGMSTIQIAPFLQKEIALPVIDPVMAEGLHMYGLCLMSKANK